MRQTARSRVDARRSSCSRSRNEIKSARAEDGDGGPDGDFCREERVFTELLEAARDQPEQDADNHG